MSVNEYRDLISEVSRMASDLKACASDEERTAWTKRAERLRLHAWAMEGLAGRATSQDKARMQRAKDALSIAFQSVIHLVVGDRKLLGI